MARSVRHRGIEMIKFTWMDYEKLEKKGGGDRMPTGWIARNRHILELYIRQQSHSYPSLAVIQPFFGPKLGPSM